MVVQGWVGIQQRMISRLEPLMVLGIKAALSLQNSQELVQGVFTRLSGSSGELRLHFNPHPLLQKQQPWPFSFLESHLFLGKCAVQWRQRHWLQLHDSGENRIIAFLQPWSNFKTLLGPGELGYLLNSPHAPHTVAVTQTLKSRTTTSFGRT